MIKEIHPLQKGFLTLAGEIAESVSFNRSIGQLFALLYINPEPLPLNEIAEICHMSKGNASLHLRTLETWGAVHRSWKPGTRKDYYTANPDLKSFMTKRLQEGITRRIEHARQRLNTLKDDPSFHENLSDPQMLFWKKRLGELEFLMEQIEKGLSLLPKWTQLQKILS